VVHRPEPARGSNLPGSIGRRVSLALALLVVLVLLVGGISVLLARSIQRSNEEIRRHTLEIQATDEIHLAFRHIFDSVQQAVVWRDAAHAGNVAAAVSHLRQQLEAYHQFEQQAGDPETEAEHAIIREVNVLAAEAGWLGPAILASVGAGIMPTEDLRALQRLAPPLPGTIRRLNAIHHARIERLINEGQGKMRGILALYVAFAGLGGLLLAAVALLVSRTIVSPLRQLATATGDIAQGEFGRRVTAASRDEIGQLSQAFNTMAERLEERDHQIRELQESLERKVRERTRELEDATERLLSAQEALVRSERAAAIGQIAAGVTHEIRTPLSALAINLQLLGRALGRRPFSVEEARPLLGTAHLEVDRINRAVEEFFRYARLPKPRIASVPLNALVQQVVDFLQARAQAARVGLSVKLDEALPPVRADGDQLREVFLNLAANAIEAMANGGDLTVETCRAADQGSDAIVVRFSDSGPGIGPETLLHIFEPFFSTKDRGLGLGLAIALRIAEEHGGTIRCRSGGAAETIFEVMLPLAPGGP